MLADSTAAIELKVDESSDLDLGCEAPNVKCYLCSLECVPRFRMYSKMCISLGYDVI